MPTDEIAPASEGQYDDYERHLAAEIVAMLPYVRTDALKVLRLVDDILKRPRPEPPRTDAA